MSHSPSKYQDEHLDLPQIEEEEEYDNELPKKKLISKTTELNPIKELDIMKELEPHQIGKLLVQTKSSKIF